MAKSSDIRSRDREKISLFFHYSLNNCNSGCYIGSIVQPVHRSCALFAIDSSQSMFACPYRVRSMFAASMQFGVRRVLVRSPIQDDNGGRLSIRDLKPLRERSMQTSAEGAFYFHSRQPSAVDGHHHHQPSSSNRRQPNTHESL